MTYSAHESFPGDADGETIGSLMMFAENYWRNWMVAAEVMG